jgi:hypothetical protein
VYQTRIKTIETNGSLSKQTETKEITQKEIRENKKQKTSIEKLVWQEID